jgi:sugar phosphate isomerase/epimerase
MSAPLAVQLYSLRDALAQDYSGVIRQVAEMGFVGVETAGFPGSTLAEAKALFTELGLTVPSMHSPLPIGAQRNEVLDTAQTLGARYIVSGGVDMRRFATLDGIKQVCDDFNEASAAATSVGLRFAIHTHWWEFEPVEEQRPYRLMMELLDPAVVWEIDTYWVQTAGFNPVEILQELGARVPLLHIKDGPAVKNEPMVAVGQGTMDFSTIIPAHAEHTEWLVVELDHCATDMLTAVGESYRYLVEKGLAHGTKS